MLIRILHSSLNRSINIIMDWCYNKKVMSFYPFYNFIIKGDRIEKKSSILLFVFFVLIVFIVLVIGQFVILLFF